MGADASLLSARCRMTECESLRECDGSRVSCAVGVGARLPVWKDGSWGWLDGHEVVTRTTGARPIAACSPHPMHSSQAKSADLPLRHRHPYTCAPDVSLNQNDQHTYSASSCAFS